MALTRIQSRSSKFNQPNIGESVFVILDADIDWIKVGMSVHIPEGGVYEVMTINGFVHELKLKTSVADLGELISVSIVHPINDDSAATFWGGDNGKEW